MIEFNDILQIRSKAEFEKLALEVFSFQFENNPVYRSFCDLLYKNPSDVRELTEIPFLPIQFFKTHDVLSSKERVQATFLSSGTSGMQRSRHLVTDMTIYRKSFLEGFKYFYSDPGELLILALLPSYLEQGDSSLVYMTEHLIKKAKKGSGFFLNNHDDLAEKLKEANDLNQKTLLLGVSYALLDFAERFPMNLENTVIMETGGMKGRRAEMVREELHFHLKNAFGVESIHSEYGMTELLSQAYSTAEGIFKCPPWMRVLTRDPEDPFSIFSNSKTGGINIIDLANINSCSFVATQDLGRVHEDGRFEIVGRFDHSDIRGCNLMAI